MPVVQVVGEFSEWIGSSFGWRIPNWKSLLNEEGDVVQSPPFKFWKATWKLEIYYSMNKKEIVLDVVRNSWKQSIQDVSYKLSVGQNDGTEYEISEGVFEFTNEYNRSYSSYIEGKTIFSNLPHDGSLTISCSFFGYRTIANMPAKSKASKCSNVPDRKTRRQSGSFYPKRESESDKKKRKLPGSMPKFVKQVQGDQTETTSVAQEFISDSKDEAESEKSIDPGKLIEGSGENSEKNEGVIEEAILTKPTAIDKLVRDFKNLLTEAKESDVTLKVKNGEFRAHKGILRTRSSVFDSMFHHDKVENNCDLIDIPDCDPEAFQYFLMYLYSASTDNLSNDITFNLYSIADKFDAEELKNKCVEFIASNLSVDTFCTVIDLALQRKEEVLLQTATDFFIKNTKQIIVSTQWESFLKESPLAANKLYIKSFDNNILHK